MQFLDDRRGSVAIVLALALIPLLGVMGASLDYGRAYAVRSFLQAQADAAATNGAVGGPAAEHASLLNLVRAEAKKSFGDTGVISGLAVTGDWVSATDYRVDVSATVDAIMVHILPGVSNKIEVAAHAVARVGEQEVSYDPPTITELDPDAGDYNQMYVYCFQPDKPGPAHARRKQMTLIADNDGKKYNFTWPKCGEGETLSFRLRNVRHVRAYPELWKNPNKWPYKPEHDYYTDTTIANGVEKFNIGYDILETVRCDTLAQCKGKSQGGILPEGTNRKPNVETKPCQPGKYMYFGWEDRPPGQPGANKTWTDPAWTDRSYDDIRVVMKCPDGGAVGTRIVRLIE